MSSVRVFARILRVERGPRTKRMASPMLDLPEPLGPVIAVNPGLKGTVRRSPKLLKLTIRTSFRYIVDPRRAALSPENKSAHDEGRRGRRPSRCIPFPARRMEQEDI